METNKNAGTQRAQIDIVNEGQRSSLHQEKSFVDGFRNATPSVQDVNVFECATAVVTITDFLNGQNGQTIRILGNPNTTIQHGTNIFTNTGANKALVADKIFTFTRVNNKWYEDE